MHACMHACIHRRMHTRVSVHMHSKVHTIQHTYSFTHTDVPRHKQKGTDMGIRAQTFMETYTQHHLVPYVVVVRSGSSNFPDWFFKSYIYLPIFLLVSPPPPPPPSAPNIKRTYTSVHVLTHTHTHTPTLTHSQIHPLRAQYKTHIHKRARTNTYTHTHTNTHSQIHTHTHKRTHTHTPSPHPTSMFHTHILLDTNESTFIIIKLRMFLTSLQQSFDLGASYHLTLRFLSERSHFIFFNSPFHFIFSISLLICSKKFDSIFLTSVTLFSVKTFFNFSISSIITRERITWK